MDFNQLIIQAVGDMRTASDEGGGGGYVTGFVN